MLLLIKITRIEEAVSTMYEYKTKTILLRHTREGLTLEEDYEMYITKQAEKGWRFVQFVNLSNLAPSERRIDLIFEKKK